MTKANLRNPFGLTHRQCEVMESLVVLGETRLVAQDLGITKETVDWHILAACKRIGASNRIQAVVKWDRNVNPRTTVFHGEKRPANSVFALAAA